jgi:hypothetical protein
LSGYSTEKEEGGDQFLSIADTTGALRYFSKGIRSKKEHACSYLNKNIRIMYSKVQKAEAGTIEYTEWQ